jgi:uncharacterized coiled-coil protein SlyX
METPPDNRLQIIESGLAHLERQYEQLNEIVIEQGRVLAKLHKQVERVAETLVEIGGERSKETQSKPPHYDAR